jgi:hypothetical protein
MELILSDSVFNRGSNGRNFWEISNREAFARWSSDNIIGRVLVSIRGLLSSLVNNFPDCVDTYALVRIDVGALSIYNSLRQVLRINPTGEQF